MLNLETITTKKLATYGALTAVALFATVNGAFAQDLTTSVTAVATQASNIPRLITGLAMPVGIFLLILGGLNLVKLGKDPNAEEMRNVIFKLLAGVFVLTLNWIIPYFQTSLGTGTTGTITAASKSIDSAF